MSDHLSVEEQEKAMDDTQSRSSSRSQDGSTSDSSDWDEVLTASTHQKQTASAEPTQILGMREHDERDLKAQVKDNLCKPKYQENNDNWDHLVEQLLKEILHNYHTTPPNDRRQYAQRMIAEFMEEQLGWKNFDIWKPPLNNSSDESDNDDWSESMSEDDSSEKSEERGYVICEAGDEETPCPHCNWNPIEYGTYATYVTEGTPNSGQQWLHLHQNPKQDICVKAFYDLLPDQQANYVFLHTGNVGPEDEADGNNPISMYDPDDVFAIFDTHRSPVVRKMDWDERFRAFGVPECDHGQVYWKSFYSYLVDKGFTVNGLLAELDKLASEVLGETIYCNDELPEDYEDNNIPVYATKTSAQYHLQKEASLVLEDVDRPTKKGHRPASNEQVATFVTKLEMHTITAFAPHGCTGLRDLANKQLECLSPNDNGGDALKGCERAQELLHYCEFTENWTGSTHDIQKIEEFQPELCGMLDDISEFGMSSFDKDASDAQKFRAFCLLRIVWLCKLFRVYPKYTVKETNKKVIDFTMKYAFDDLNLWNIHGCFGNNRLAMLQGNADNANNQEESSYALPRNQSEMEAYVYSRMLGFGAEAQASLMQGDEESAVEAEVERLVGANNSQLMLTNDQEDGRPLGLILAPEAYHKARVEKQFEVAKETVKTYCERVKELEIRQWQCDRVTKLLMDSMPELAPGGEKFTTFANSFIPTGSHPADHTHDFMTNNPFCSLFMGVPFSGDDPVVRCHQCGLACKFGKWSTEDWEEKCEKTPELRTVQSRAKLVKLCNQPGYVIGGMRESPVRNDTPERVNPKRACVDRREKMGIYVAAEENEYPHACQGDCYNVLINQIHGQHAWGTNCDKAADTPTPEDIAYIEAVQADMEKQNVLEEEAMAAVEEKRRAEQALQDADKALKKRDRDIKAGCKKWGIDQMKLGAMPIQHATADDCNKANAVAAMAAHFEAQQKLSEEQARLNAQKFERANLARKAEEAQQKATKATAADKAYKMEQMARCLNYNSPQTATDVVLEAGEGKDLLKRQGYYGNGSPTDFYALMKCGPYMLNAQLRNNDKAAEYYDPAQNPHMANSDGHQCQPPMQKANAKGIAQVIEDFARQMARVVTNEESTLSNAQKAKLFLGKYYPGNIRYDWQIYTPDMRDWVTGHTDPQRRGNFYEFVACTIKKMPKKERMDLWVDGFGDTTRECVLEHASPSFRQTLEKEYADVIDMDVKKYANLCTEHHSEEHIGDILMKKSELGDPRYIKAVAKQIKRKRETMAGEAEAGQPKKQKLKKLKLATAQGLPGEVEIVD